MKPTNQDMNVFAKNVGSILVNLPLLVRQSRHESIEGTLYYIDPKEVAEGDVDLKEAWEFVKDLFEAKNEKILKKWYAWHPSMERK
jgi:hypothetical protein